MSLDVAPGIGHLCISAKAIKLNDDISGELEIPTCVCPYFNERRASGPISFVPKVLSSEPSSIKNCLINIFWLLPRLIRLGA